MSEVLLHTYKKGNDNSSNSDDIKPIAGVGEDLEKLKLLFILVEGKVVQSLKKSLSVPPKVNHRIIISPRNSFIRHVL
jgi:hypothetical protein